MKNIVRLANQFILLRGVDRLPLDMERLRMLCAAEKLVLLSYGEAEGLIESLALQAHTKRNAFLLQTQDVGLVLYKDTLPLGAKLFAIAHELGHCFLGHTFYGVREQNFENTAQEREADTFALHILAPPCVLRERHLRTVGEIQAETLLDREQAVLALQRASPLPTRRPAGRRGVGPVRADAQSARKHIGKAGKAARTSARFAADCRRRDLSPSVPCLQSAVHGHGCEHLRDRASPCAETRTGGCRALPKRVLPSAVLPDVPVGRSGDVRRGGALYGLSALRLLPHGQTI